MLKLPKIQPLPRWKIRPGNTYDIARCVLAAIDPDDKAEVIAPALADYWLELTALHLDERVTYHLETVRDAQTKQRHPAGIATGDRATAKRWLIKALLLGCRVTCESDADCDTPTVISIAEHRKTRRQQNVWNRELEERCKGDAPRGDGSFQKSLAAEMAKAAAYRKQLEKTPLTKKQELELLSGAGTKWYCHNYDARDPAFIKELGDEPFRLVKLLSCDCKDCICEIEAHGISAGEYDQYLRQHRPSAEEAARLAAKD